MSLLRKGVLPTLLLIAWTTTQAQNQGDLEQALVKLNKDIAKNPADADAFHSRGCIYFKLGRFEDSIKDFDKYIEIKPDRKASHWQRGISYYYAGRFEDGRKQFEGYQTVDSNDVENAVWRYLCMARASGVEKARAGILKIGNDRRVPMMQVYALYSGQAKPEAVL